MSECRTETGRKAGGNMSFDEAVDELKRILDGLRAALGDAVAPYITWNGRKYHIDLKRINALWLRKAGVAEIDISDDCTACRNDLYWSHRRQGNARGSQIAMISLEDRL